jgi:hypothetical protein
MAARSLQLVSKKDKWLRMFGGAKCEFVSCEILVLMPDCLGGLGILGLLFVIDLSEQYGKCLDVFLSFLFCFSLQVKQFTGTANM